MLSPVEFLSKDAARPQKSDGRSGSLFCFSPDRKFIIKTIPDHEFQTLVSILPYYYAVRPLIVPESEKKKKMADNSCLCVWFSI